MLRTSIRVFAAVLVGWVLCSSGIPLHADQPHVVMLIAEQEYETNESLPAFASHWLTEYQTTFVFEDPQDRNRLVGIDAVNAADVLLVSVRRRTLPSEQLDVVRSYVDAGKPVIGIRTASHAFSLRNDDPPPRHAVWPEFDRQVFGGNYTNHYGNALKATIRLVDDIPVDLTHLVRGIPAGRTFDAGGSLYRVSPLADGTRVLIRGEVEGESSEPVAWAFQRADGGKSFYTSLGHVDDFKGPVLPQLLANAIEWSLTQEDQKPIPTHRE